MDYRHAEYETGAFDPFKTPPRDFFEGLHLSLELMRDGCIRDQAIMADERIGSGRAYVYQATPKMRELLLAGGWAPLPDAEAVGLPTDLMFIEDPVTLPTDAPLTLAHLVVKHYVDELRKTFGREDGVFFPRAVERQPVAWVRSVDRRSVVDAIIEREYLSLGSKTPLIVAHWLSNRTAHEVARLNPWRAAAGLPGSDRPVDRDDPAEVEGAKRTAWMGRWSEPGICPARPGLSHPVISLEQARGEARPHR